MEFGVLGPLQVWSGGRPVQVGAPMQRALLAALLLHANEIVTAEQLIDYLWGETPPPSARATLQNYVLRLRRLLPERPDGAARQVLVTRAPGYLIRLQPEELDLDRFQRLVAGARASATQGQFERAAITLRDALALWRGSPLCDVAAEALRRTHVPRLEEQRLAALEARIDADLHLGRHAELIAELKGLVEDQPLQERFRAQLMLALYRCGRQAEALQVYRSTWRLLQEELGIQPGPELRELEQAILREDLSLHLPAIPAAGRPHAAAIGRPHQLPPAIADFTGRVRELERLDRLLEPDEPAAAVAISAIVGTAGVGKTALAVHWAQRAREQFPDGQLYANLRGYAPTPPLRPIQALAGFLHALGVAAEQVPVDLDEAAAMYRTLLARKRMLVLLDNACGPEQVRPLLPGSPGCLVVVTSRDRLDGLGALAGDQLHTLDVLDPQEAGVLLTRLLGQQRVRAEPEAAATLARACALLPLALRIAAANLAHRQHQPLASYVMELEAGNRLAALEACGDEHAAVSAAFDLSYATLAPEPRRLFRLLGLVPGPDVSAEAAAALAGSTAEQAARLLERLAAAHLVEQHTPGRFGLHDLLRLYAAERTREEGSEADRQVAIEGLYDWYLHTADAAARVLYPRLVRLPLSPDETRPPGGFDGHSQALAWLDAERPSLVAAILDAATHGPRPAAWLLADTLRGYFWLRMHTVDWLAAAHAGLAAAEAEDAVAAQAATQLSLADAHMRQGRYQQAVEHYTRALVLNQQTGWLEGQSAALSNLGVVYWRLGRLHDAVDHHTQSLTIDRQTGRLAGQAASLGNLGSVYQELGRLEQAVDHDSQALALWEKLECRSDEAIDLASLGLTYLLLGRLDQALGHLTRALALHREVGDRSSEADTLRILAEVHRDAGRHSQALDLAHAVVALARDVGDHRYEADALNALATIHLRLAQHAQAIDHHQRALRMARETETRFHQAGYLLLEGQALTALAAVSLDRDDPDRAICHAQQALAIHRETGHRLGEARTRVVLGRALDRIGHREAALPHWQAAVALFSDVGTPDADQVRRLLHTR